MGFTNDGVPFATGSDTRELRPRAKGELDAARAARGGS